MSLDNYLVKARGYGAEIRYEFSPEEVQQLYNRAKELGYKQYRLWVAQHLPDIQKYISLSQSQRQQKKWVNHPENLLIRLASVQISSSTDEFLQDIDPIAYCVDRGSYRSFHSLIADALSFRLFQYPLRNFPFEGFDNPFSS